jgi:hypothetical protein
VKAHAAKNDVMMHGWRQGTIGNAGQLKPQSMVIRLIGTLRRWPITHDKDSGAALP